MPTLQVEHGVHDYERWKDAFDSDPVGREAGGVRSYRILRVADDSGRVLIELDFDSMDEAAVFLERLRRLWGEAGTNLGLVDPSARIVDVVETHAY